VRHIWHQHATAHTLDLYTQFKMIIRIIGTLFLSAFLCVYAFAHSGKPKFHVIIDTIGAIDDMRAISMFLSGNDIRVLAISCSQGTLFPDTVFVKVNSNKTSIES